ncbi:hypothetical protein HQ590_08380 [bacterium]|nr:hypothetical protein [bacterium]
MKRSAMPFLIALVGTVLLVVSARGQTVTNDVFGVRLVVRGVYQDVNEISQEPLIGEALLKSGDVVNLALGRPVSSAVPPHEVLAWVRDRADHNKQLIVYDLLTQSRLATVAIIKSEGRVREPGKAIFIWKLKMQETGNETNGLTGDELNLSGIRGRLETQSGAKLKLKGRGNGTLDVTSGGESYHVLAPQVRMAVSRPPIGILVTEP